VGVALLAGRVGQATIKLEARRKVLVFRSCEQKERQQAPSSSGGERRAETFFLQSWVFGFCFWSHLWVFGFFNDQHF
jgi:hypothetical protein